MKKLLFATLALAVSLSAAAQKVIPVKGILTQVAFDSLRVKYPDRVAYLNELKQLDHQLDVSKQELSQAQKQLKDEKTHYKNATAFIKERTKELKTLEKSYQNEKKVQEGYLKLIDKQHKAVMKEDYIDTETRDAYIADLNQRKRQMEKTSIDYETKIKNVQNEYEILKTQQIDMTQYDLQIKSKELEIKQMTAQIKSTKDAIKAEMKATEAIIKAQ